MTERRGLQQGGESGGGVATVAPVSILVDDVSCGQVLLTRDVVGSSEAEV